MGFCIIEIQSYLINLERRPDRLKTSLEECDKVNIDPIVVKAIDGNLCKLPKGFKAGPGAFGCLQSHLSILEKNNDSNILILEDDVYFIEEWTEFYRNVPSNWDVLFLGGQHLIKPIRVNDVYNKCIATARTHAYIVNYSFKKTLADIYRNSNGHIDNEFIKHQRKYNCYSPHKWICGQRSDFSDIQNKEVENRIWERYTSIC